MITYSAMNEDGTKIIGNRYQWVDIDMKKVGPEFTEAEDARQFLIDYAKRLSS